MEWTCMFLYLEEYFAAVSFIFGLQHVCFATITSDVIFGFHITIDSWHPCVVSCQWWYVAVQFTVLICGFASVKLSFLIYSFLISYFLLHIRFRKPMKQGRSSQMRNLFHQPNSLGIITKLLMMLMFLCRSSQYVLLPKLITRKIIYWILREFFSYAVFMFSSLDAVLAQGDENIK